MSIEGVNPWNFHPSTEAAFRQSKKSMVVDAGKEDAQKIADLFVKNLIKGWGIQRIMAIQNKHFEPLFEAKLKIMKARSRDANFRANWKVTDSEQQQLLDELKKITKESSDYKHFNVMPMFHGTRADLLMSISQGGFTNLSRRISHSSYPQFAQEQGDGAILVNCVAYLYPYPLTSFERSQRLKRGFDDLTCDAYYARVASADGSTTFNELCILDVSQVLPMFIVTLSPEGLKVKEIALKSDSAPKPSKSTAPSINPKVESGTAKLAITTSSTDDGSQLYQRALSALSTGNYDDAIACLKLAAQAGHSDAIATLADCYFDATGVVKDLRLALELYQRAANKKHPWALFRVGESYYEGVIVAKDSAVAFKNVENAIKFGLSKGLGTAYGILGTCYREGTGVPKDFQKAIDNYDLAVKNGNADALAYKGWIIGQKNTKEALKTAFECYCQSAELKSKWGQFNAGACLRDGLGTKKDYKKALEYLLAAAHQKHVNAQWSVSLFYQRRLLGELIIDWAKVKHWAQQAADQGHLEAKTYLISLTIS